MCGISKTPWLAFDFKINTFREAESISNVYILLAFYLSSSNSEIGNNFLSLSEQVFLWHLCFLRANFLLLVISYIFHLTKHR